MMADSCPMSTTKNYFSSRGTLKLCVASSADDYGCQICLSLFLNYAPDLTVWVIDILSTFFVHE